MNGLSNYNHVDNSGSVSPRNIGTGRPSFIGTLIHTTGGVDSLRWLLSGAAESGNPATANFLIERDGTRHQIIPQGQWGYHAGVSTWYSPIGRLDGDAISRHLVGVELEQLGDQLVTFEQSDSLAELIVQLGLDTGWRWPYILKGHYDVARPLGRRSDPQGLDWGGLMGRLYVRAQAAQVGGL